MNSDLVVARCKTRMWLKVKFGNFERCMLDHGFWIAVVCVAPLSCVTAVRRQPSLEMKSLSSVVAG